MELGRGWEEGIPWLLLASREVVQESSGFSPNELVFGHSVRGPMALLKDVAGLQDPPQPLCDYVNGFKRHLYEAARMARENLTTTQVKMKQRYDQKAQRRVFSVGDKVLSLLPIISSPFQAKFAGPYTVIKKVSDINSVIATPERRKSSQLCHVNLLKPYHERSDTPTGGAVVQPVALTDGVLSSISPVDPSVAAQEQEVIRAPDDRVLRACLNNSDTLKLTS